MSAKIDSAVLNVIADSLERIQGAINNEYKKAERDTVEDSIYSKLDDIFSAEVENLRDLADNDEDDES